MTRSRTMTHDAHDAHSLLAGNARADGELYGKMRHGASCVMAHPRARDVAEGAILDLADRLRRLAPSPRNPELFHEEKSEIVHALRMIAGELGR